MPKPEKGVEPPQFKQYRERVQSVRAQTRAAAVTRQDEIAEAMALKQESDVDKALRFAAEGRISQFDPSGETRRKYEQIQDIESQLKDKLTDISGELSYEDAAAVSDPTAKARRDAAYARFNTLTSLLQRARLLKEGYLYGDPEAAELLSAGGSADATRALLSDIDPDVLLDLDPEVRSVLENEVFDDSSARSLLDTRGLAGRYATDPEGARGGLMKYHKAQVRRGRELLLQGENDRAIEDAIEKLPQGMDRREVLSLRQEWLRALRDQNETAAIAKENLARQAYGQKLAQAMQARRRLGPGKNALGDVPTEPLSESAVDIQGGYWRAQRGFRKKTGIPRRG